MSTVLASLRVNTLWNDIRVLQQGSDLLDEIRALAGSERWEQFLNEIIPDTEEGVQIRTALATRAFEDNENLL